MTKLRLYSRPDCHLCEVADALLDKSGARPDIERVNIEEDLTLVRRYGESVPVLQRMDTEAEIFWPFDEAGLVRFLKNKN